MIAISHLFKDLAQLEKHLKDFDIQDELHFRIFTPVLNGQQALQLAQDIKQHYYNASVVGCSVQGVIYNGRQYSDQTLIVVEKFEKSVYQSCLMDFDVDGMDATLNAINAKINTQSANLCRMLAATRLQDAGDLVNAFNGINPKTKLVGGIASQGYDGTFDEFVFNDNKVSSNGLVVESIFNTELSVFNHVNSSHDPISGNHYITKCNGKVISEIDNQDVFEWISQHFGQIVKNDGYTINIDSDNPLVWFNLLINGNKELCRFLMYNAQGKNIETIGALTQNTSFQIGYTSPHKVIDDCQTLVHNITTTPVEQMFCYICVYRRLFLKNCAEWELAPLDSKNFAGAFFHGEISYLNGKNEFLNGATVFSGIAEYKRFMKINNDAFENMEKIAVQNNVLLEYIQNRLKNYTSPFNKDALNLILQNEENYRKNLYVNINLELPNLVRYEHDCNLYDFNKICYIRIQNADLFINYMGQASYYQKLKDFINEFNQFILNSNDNRKCLFNIYCINEDSFIIASNATSSITRFTDSARQISNFFRSESSAYFKFPVMTKMIVVSDVENLLERAYEALQNNLHNQNSFVIYDCNNDDNEAILKRELEILEAIQYAIDHSRVVPYYQPIIDNRDFSVKGYESLMRIFDKDDKIYYPNDFMPIAKKYRLYLDLGAQMILKVFEEVERTDCVISVNLSAYNINSKRFKKFVLNQLSTMKNTNKIAFEILEDECFDDIKPLADLLQEIKQYGVRVAIDDFGSGYSNLLELVKMRPNIIKIDGEIIKGIVDNELNRVIVSTIVALAKNLNVEIVAEHVENAEILEVLKTFGIEYSQGYYFAKPLCASEAFKYQFISNDD